MAFDVYTSVMTEDIHKEKKEIDLYERNIIDVRMRHSRSGFYKYHIVLRQQLVYTYKSINLKIYWSIQDNIL